MKNKRRLMRIFLIIIQILIILSYNMVFASELTNGINIHKNQANQFIEPGNAVIKVLQTIGIVSSIIALMLLGIRFMLGSVEERAEYKQTFPVYLLGIALVFGISVFAEAIDKVISSI